MPEYLTMKEAQALLGIDEDAMFNLIQDNKLRNYRIDRETRFKEAEVLAFARARGADGPDTAAAATVVESADAIEESSFAELELIDAAPADSPPTRTDAKPATSAASATGATNKHTLEIEIETEPSAEIQFQDDFIADDVSTQRITVVGKPVSAQSADDIQVAEEEELAVGASPRDIRDAAARSKQPQATEQVRRRQLAQAAASRDSGELLWAAFLAVSAAVVIVLAGLMAALALSDFTNHPPRTAASSLSDSGQLPALGGVQQLWSGEGWFGSVNSIVGIGENEWFGRPPRKESKPATPAPAASSQPSAGAPEASATPVEAPAEGAPQ